MPITTDLLLAWAAGMATFGVVLSGLWRLIKPWVREQIAAPVQEIHQQVTKNHHESDPPTLLDKFDTLHQEVRAMRRDLTEVVVWKHEEHRNIDRRLALIEGWIDRAGPRPDDS